jgi:hypothetical protein
MGKRSNNCFERVANDFYATPFKAVPPLIPFLRGIKTFAEPCCGDGDLIRHLESFGLRCVWCGDIHTDQDALLIDSYGEPDAIITNPPYIRDVMHAMIKHFQHIAPTWLLLEADWAQNKHAAPFLFACSHIVSVGRLKWIRDSRHSGFDNFAWYKFEAGHTAGPVFHGRGQVPPRRMDARVCSQCGEAYQPQRSSLQFCTSACRQRAYRDRASVTVDVTTSSIPPRSSTSSSS